jgi:hypothetical protein
MADSERKIGAVLRRQTAVVSRTTLQRHENDPTPLSGVPALSLVQHLTRECWALARKEIPTYRRQETPVRFVPGRLT